MQIFTFKRSKVMLRYPVISAMLALLLFAGLLPAFAEEEGSISALRQMGKAFAGIAGKASPAVVAVRAERTVNQNYP